MARQTRQQRQQRRKQDGAPSALPESEAQPASLSERARQRQAQIRPTAPARTPTARRAEERGGVVRFVQESWGELKKVEWPNQRQVIQGTVVVLIACLVVGVFLYASDQAFQHLVQNVLLR